MIADLLSSAVPVASDILERTASTPRVQQIVSLSLAPAFLLAAIGAIMNVLVSRMIWIANRIERIDDRIEDVNKQLDYAQAPAVWGTTRIRSGAEWLPRWPAAEVNPGD